MVESFYQIALLPAPRALPSAAETSLPLSASLGLFFLILQPAHCHGGSLLDSLQVVSISFLVGGREWPENQTQYSRWVCMSAEHYNHSSQPTAFTLANAAWDGVNFHCRESCCWFMSHLLSVRTSASFLAVVVLASYYTTSAKGWSGFVPDIGPWCLPWLCFIKFLVYFSSLSFFLNGSSDTHLSSTPPVCSLWAFWLYVL